MPRKHKLEAKSLLDSVKAHTAEVKKTADAKAEQEKLQAQILNEQNEPKKQGEKNMKLTKQDKHELAILKLYATMKAKNESSIVTEASFSALVTELVEAKQYNGIECKAIELTTDHATLMRQIQSSDMIFSFDPKSEAGEILSLFKRYDLPVSGQVTVPVDDESLELQHMTTETAAVAEQTFDESPFVLKTSRSAMNVKVSRSLVFKSIVDLLSYIEGRINLAVARGMAEGIINGQGANSAQQDNAYPATKMGSKAPGIRAILSAGGYTLDAANKELDTTDGRALLQSMFDAAGARFSRNQKSYVILAARPEKLKISALKLGAGVTGVNQSAAGAVYDDTYQGVRVIETGFLISRTAANASGYSETGFVKSNTTLNDHGSLVLLDPSMVWWHYGAERYDVEIKPSTDSYDITLNCQAGWNMLCNARNQPGVLVVNIGANIGTDS